jgi:murein L,D-transpeptidase YafK
MRQELKNAPLAAAFLALTFALIALTAQAQDLKSKNTATPTATEQRKSKPSKPRKAKSQPKTEAVWIKNQGSHAETRLIEIYKLIGQAKSREALPLAERLIHEHPNFQLAQLVYGDLLTAQSQPLRALGDVPDTAAKAGALRLAELRKESQLRLQALRERPAAGLVPSQLINLSTQNKHAIAIDASRSRLYLFENSATGLKLLGDYYISIGKSGIEKAVEGDLRTPLGVYFVTSNLNPKSLNNFYGSGALPINYPNQLDLKRGKTGSGIWLHGSPPDRFARAPLATDGCVVLSNPDLERIIKMVRVRTTPVVIAQSLKWLAPQTIQADNKPFEEALIGWQSAKSSGDITQLMTWYTPDFSSNGKTLKQWTPALQAELLKLNGRQLKLKDVSYLRWTDANDTMVVTFGELANGAKTGRTKRQYWTRQGSQWKIFFEGVIG